DRSRFMNALRSACHCLVSRVMTAELSPAAEPKNSSRAGTKSPVDMPCRYSSGSTSVTFGLLRHHGATMAERNRWRPPEAGVDATVVHPGRLDLDGTRRRGDGARLGMPVADHQPSPLLVALVDEGSHVGVDLSLQRGGQHPAGPLPHDLVQSGRGLLAAVV